VNANLSDVPLPNTLRQIFDGTYSDFVRSWYISVGVGLTMTMLINTAAPQLKPLLETFVLTPLHRFFRLYCRSNVMTEQQMMDLYTGPPFDISLRYDTHTPRGYST
jgi:hypothetical protein